MRYLKNKLARARQNVPRHQDDPEEGLPSEEESEVSEDRKDIQVKFEPDTSEESTSTDNNKRKKTTRVKKEPESAQKKKSERGATSAKNIVKNYGRALANFAASNLALPYLTALNGDERVKVKDFRRFIASKKKQARCIKGLRNLLIVEEEDTPSIAAFKRIFKDISVIFIKYFSVNWIFSGKLCDKITHLKYRFKILRRIRDPEHFTYLKGFS